MAAGGVSYAAVCDLSGGADLVVSRRVGRQPLDHAGQSSARKLQHDVSHAGAKAEAAAGVVPLSVSRRRLGWGGFRSSNSSATSNQFAGDIGGGADFNLLSILSLRGEVRDDYTSSPRLDVQSVFHGNVNNVISGGVVFRF